jgi:hypothetical protein
MNSVFTEHVGPTPFYRYSAKDSSPKIGNHVSSWTKASKEYGLGYPFLINQFIDPCSFNNNVSDLSVASKIPT